MKITFLGATDTVTGSRFLVEARGQRLLVDCGLFQGVKRLRERNRQPFPVDPASIDAVVITHAHIDHSGFLPALIAEGFRGPIVASEGTAALCAILWPDSGHLQEEEARFRNKHKRTKHDPAMPLYTAEEGEQAATRVQVVDEDTDVEILPGISIRLTPTGHILGACSVLVDDGARKVAFSGDVGREHDPIMAPPRPLPAADAYVCESTYGNRRHRPNDVAAELAEIVRTTIERGGTLLIPSFAVGRAQAILHLLAEAKAQGDIPDVPIFLNSPMAIRATEVFCEHIEDQGLSPAQTRALDAVATATPSVEQSKALNRRKDPKIILSASGMATGGRIIHHLEAYLGDARSTVLFVGFQAAGTRGEALVNGAPRIKVFGRYHQVHADVRQIHGLSAHADQGELLAWLAKSPEPPAGCWFVHGEPAARDEMRRVVRDELGWRTFVPEFGDVLEV